MSYSLISFKLFQMKFIYQEKNYHLFIDFFIFHIFKNFKMILSFLLIEPYRYFFDNI